MYKGANILQNSAKIIKSPLANAAFHGSRRVHAPGASYKTPSIKKIPVITKAKYGGRQMVTMVPGSGIGPEIMQHLRHVFKFAGAPVHFDIVKVGKTNDEEMADAILSIKRNGVAICGSIGKGQKDGNVIHHSRNVMLRNELDLFVNVVHCRSLPVRARQQNIDLVIVRQNTEGEYSMLEHKTVEGVVESLKVITKTNTERVARYAFDYANSQSRRKVTTIHKANIMKKADGLFLSTTRRIAKEYPTIEHDDMIVDNCCMQLVTRPEQFDVLIMPNLYGAIITNIACGILGGAGLYAARNYGERYAVFEPAIRNAGNRIAGKNIANPISMLNAGVDLLKHLEHKEHAHLIQKAILKTIIEDRILTPDLGGAHTTSDVTKAVIHNIARSARVW